MSSSPNPTLTTNYVYELTASATPGRYTASSATFSPLSTQDMFTSPGDNLSILGDIASDTFLSTDSNSNTYTFTYVGKTFLSDEVVYSYNGGAFLLSNALGSSGRVVDVDPGPYTIVCFAAGTNIATSRGEVAVEDLQIGDLAVTSSGELHPIRWIGHRTIDCSRRSDRAAVLPVRIAAGALGENKPERDLLVSPGHSICLDVLGEVLIPASALVNGTTITQEQVDEVTYWHVELDRHDILIANGQPAESYLDMGNRTFFAGNSVVGLSDHPDVIPAVRTHADFCRPFHGAGAVVNAARAKLQQRANMLDLKMEYAELTLATEAA